MNLIQNKTIKFNKKDKEKGLKLPTKMNNSLSYLCGVLAGDGNIGYRENKKEYSVKCVGNPYDEKEFYNKIISKKLKKIFGLKPKMRLYDSKTTYGFRIFSKSLVIFLTEIIGLPLNKKYNTLKVPLIFKKNIIYKKEFLKGVFDTDGCITLKKTRRYPVISIASKSLRFIKDLSKIFKELEINNFNIYSYNVKDERIKKGYTRINRIEINGHKNLKVWVNKIGSNNPKHINKINRIINSEGRI